MFRIKSKARSVSRIFRNTTVRPFARNTCISNTLQRRYRDASYKIPSKSDQVNLVDLNSTTLGVKMPEVILANGVKVQTGTVGALLINISAYDKIIQRLESTLNEDKEELRAEATRYEQLLKVPLPLLHKVGLFNLFRPEEWMDGESPGRRYVGRCALDAGM